jgi:hypothetical protein
MAGGGEGMKLEVTKPTMPKTGITKGCSPDIGAQVKLG